MRAALGALALALALALVLSSTLLVHADPKLVQHFTGSGPLTTTPYFNLGDNWQVQWSSVTPVHVTILGADGTPLAAFSGMGHGNVYQKGGGVFSLRITAEPDANTRLVDWRIAVVQFDSAAAAEQPGNFKDPDFTSTFDQHGPVSGVKLPTSSGTNQVATTATPDLPPVKLTPAQTAAIVMVRGDNAEGTGFLVKMPDGPAVVTNLHVLSDNPNVKITTNSGDVVALLGMKGASDRDLAVLPIKDNNYSYLNLAPDVGKVAQAGDQVVTPGNSEGGEVVLDTQGLVMGIGPEKIEFNNPIYHGNSGGPVFDGKSGQVLGVVTEAEKVDVSDSLDKSSFSNRNSAITGAMRYFGLRLDTVPKWETYNWDQFQTQTAFIESFHHLSECLDSFLNGQEGGNGDSDRPSATMYLSNDKIKKARDDFHSRADGADVSQRMDALRGLLFDLESIADSNMVPIQDKANFYSFEQTRAQDEIDYRKWLRKELDSIGNNVDRLNGLAHSDN